MAEYDEATRKRVNKAISSALADFRASDRRVKRHRCDVTADRLGDDLAKYWHLLSGAERDEISRVRFALQQIASGERS